MQGYAKKNMGSIEQQVIAGGANATSLNDHSRYASGSQCIGIRYANQNGISLGLTTASLTSFDTTGATYGFTLNVNNLADADGLVVLYTAYKY